MGNFYFDNDADLSVLDSRQIAIIGYGNQGRAQALNLRDSGIDVKVGNITDDNLKRAQADGFPTMAISEAAAAADILFILVPDEIQRGIFDEEVAPHLKPGSTLNFAHGYNIRFGKIRPPKNIDIILVAPRMVGVSVRELYLSGSGASAFIAVEQDFTGMAKSTALAIAKGIGSTRAGVLESSFAEETELDLFSEQAIWPAIIRLFMLSFEILTERGFQPEAVLTELYASGEAARVLQKMADHGVVRQLPLHSQTSQFGTLSRLERILPPDFGKRLVEALEQIQDGTFAREWERAGQQTLDRLRQKALTHAINLVEEQLVQDHMSRKKHVS